MPARSKPTPPGVPTRPLVPANIVSPWRWPDLPLPAGTCEWTPARPSTSLAGRCGSAFPAPPFLRRGGAVLALAVGTRPRGRSVGDAVRRMPAHPPAFLRPVTGTRVATTWKARTWLLASAAVAAATSGSGTGGGSSISPSTMASGCGTWSRLAPLPIGDARSLAGGKARHRGHRAEQVPRDCQLPPAALDPGRQLRRPNARSRSGGKGVGCKGVVSNGRQPPGSVTADGRQRRMAA